MSPESGSPEGSKNCLYVLLTGANSGLGLSICNRLLDEFVATQVPHLSLHLIITTRDKYKSHDTVLKLRQRLRKKPRNILVDPSKNVFLTAEQVDLTSLRSVCALSEKISKTFPRIDVMILNAGYGGYTAINWPGAVWQIMTDFKAAMTYPTFQIAGVGQTTKRQSDTGNEEPALGQVFCANVFGHYMLVRCLAPLLNRSRQSTSDSLATLNGRVIWISSIEAYASTFSLDDFQGIASQYAYKSSKRLTDILALTSLLPAASPSVSKLLNHEGEEGARPPKMYLAHPGICATSFIPLNIILYYLMTLFFYIARWIGSPWHTVSSYKGACAPVWLTLASQEELDSLEADGKSKWGSCVDIAGNERVTRTEVEGWGLRGKVEPLDSRQKRGRRNGVTEVTVGQLEEFQQLGKECWQRMDELSEHWRRRLDVEREHEEQKL